MWVVRKYSRSSRFSASKQVVFNDRREYKSGSVKVIIMFTLVGAVLGIALYYLLVKAYYWSPRGPSKKP